MSIENMDFNYGDRNEKLLNNINLDIRKGEKQLYLEKVDAVRVHYLSL